MQEGEEYKTAFSTHLGHYEFKVVAFGLSRVPRGHECHIEAPVASLCYYVLQWLIYSKTFEDHLKYIHQVLSLLAKDQWHIKLSKCRFAQNAISYLGHIVSGQGIVTDSSKVDALLLAYPNQCQRAQKLLGPCRVLSALRSSLCHHFQASHPCCSKRTQCSFVLLIMTPGSLHWNSALA